MVKLTYMKTNLVGYASDNLCSLPDFQRGMRAPFKHQVRMEGRPLVLQIVAHCYIWRAIAGASCIVYECCTLYGITRISRTRTRISTRIPFLRPCKKGPGWGLPTRSGGWKPGSGFDLIWVDHTEAKPGWRWPNRTAQPGLVGPTWAGWTFL